MDAGTVGRAALQRLMVAERIGRPLRASVLRAGELTDRTIVPTPLRVE